MVPELLRRQRLALAALAVAAVAVTALVAATQPNGGAASVVVALVLAPLVVAATAVLGSRIAGERFGVAAAAVVVVLPLLANRFMLPAYRHIFDAHALPSLVGTEHTAILALGLVAAALCIVLPAGIAAAGGLLAFVVAALLWHFEGLGQLTPAFHETVWSVSLTEWLVAAGILGGLLRAPFRAAAVGGWLLAVVLWGAHRGYDGALFWQSLAAAMPAAAVVLSSLALLVPRLRPAPRRSAAPTDR